jgi:hypothetical protein
MPFGVMLSRFHCRVQKMSFVNSGRRGRARNEERFVGGTGMPIVPQNPARVKSAACAERLQQGRYRTSSFSRLGSHERNSACLVPAKAARFRSNLCYPRYTRCEIHVRRMTPWRENPENAVLCREWMDPVARAVKTCKAYPRAAA